MNRTSVQLKNALWIDYTDLQKTDVEALSTQEKIPLKILRESLRQENLPKFEKNLDSLQIILRVYDPKKKATADSVQQLTTKIVLFQTQTQLLSLHRLDIDFLNDLKKRPINELSQLEISHLIQEIYLHSIHSFESPILDLNKKSEAFEEAIFKLKRKDAILRDGYYLKRKASSFRKVLKLMGDTLTKISTRPDCQGFDFQIHRDFVDRLLFYVEEINENVTMLLNLHLSLSSHQTNMASYRTNEVMRVLTVVSIFFLPLNFIAGLYGMNFENMPELKDEHGYYYILGVMAFVSFGLFFWMYRKGWMQGISEDT